MILGHERIRSRLADAVARDTLHHAYLFEGPRGVGKRAVAIELAMRVNCTSPPEARPCGGCPTCRSIAAGTHPDVVALEPDLEKASRAIPIEAIREIIRQSQYHRYGARRRFVIVDPAEAMQEPAANALLKTLEEPPSGTGFVVITHNPRALLPTILSRCQRIRFGAVPVEAIGGWLAARGLANADAAARLSHGCPGRALDLAEQGLDARIALRTEITSVLASNLARVYEFSGRITQGSRQEWASAVDELLEHLEDLVRDAAIRATGAAVPLMDDPADSIVERLAATWPDGITRCSRAILDAREDLEVFVSGKTVVDALMTSLRREIASTPRGSGASG